jgi:hypothetical protein
MNALDFEVGIEHFLTWGRDLQKRTSMTAEDALTELVRWYQSTRIRGAQVQEDGDMLLLQWGDIQPCKLLEPTDLRKFSSDDFSIWDTTRYLYIDLTRQVFAQKDDYSAEFDDVAVHMSITLLYEPAAHPQEGSYIYIPSPEDVETHALTFRTVPFVRERLCTSTSRVVVTVGHCG